jgi:hypothetical protein
MTKLGRNDPCYCGSGRKYKKCCLIKDSRGPRSPPPVRPVPRAAASGRGRRPKSQASDQPSLPSPEKILTRLEEVTAALAALPAPLPGRLRVFRGQTRDFGKMLASQHRAQPPGDVVFRAYSLGLAESLMAGSASKIRRTDLWTLWTQAIAQHYGPGSEFLDVTHSLDVALWFALHRSEQMNFFTITGPPGPFDPEKDITSDDSWIKYHRSESCGWLYVFDVPKWRAEGHPGHGELIDLAEAPAVFAASTRIRAQQACLVGASRSVDDGDLRAFYVCEPIAVAWPMTGASGLNRRTDELFPPPLRDDWFARFLGIPYSARTDDDGNLAFSHALEVTHYFYETPDFVEDVRRRHIAISPYFVFPIAADMLAEQKDPEILPLWRGRDPAKATRIVLESPLKRILPTGNAKMWNHGLLATGLSDEIEAFDITGAPGGKVALDNVFVEFSPLEELGWETLESSEQEREVLRGMWLARDGAQFTVYLVYHLFKLLPAQGGAMGSPLVSQTIRTAGPLLCEVDAASRRFEVRSRPDHAWQTLPSFLEYALFSSLMVLRELSDGLKVSPIPMSTLEKSHGGYGFVAAFRLAAARLVRVRDTIRKTAFYMVKAIDSNEAFVTPGRPVGAFMFDSDAAWPDCDPELLNRLMEAEIIRAMETLGQHSGSAGDLPGPDAGPGLV